MLRVLCCIRSLTRRYSRCAAPLACAIVLLICTTLARLRRRAGTAPRAASQTALAAWPAFRPRRRQPFRWWCPSPSPSRTTRSSTPFRTSLPLLHLRAHQPLPRRPRLPIFRPPRPPPHPRARRRFSTRNSVLRRPQIRAWVQYRVIPRSESAWSARRANAIRSMGTDAFATKRASYLAAAVPMLAKSAAGARVRLPLPHPHRRCHLRTRRRPHPLPRPQPSTLVATKDGPPLLPSATTAFPNSQAAHLHHYHHHGHRHVCVCAPL